jgi:hypothetical protein
MSISLRAGRLKLSSFMAAAIERCGISAAVLAKASDQYQRKFLDGVFDAVRLDVPLQCTTELLSFDRSNTEKRDTPAFQPQLFMERGYTVQGSVITPFVDVSSKYRFEAEVNDNRYDLCISHVDFILLLALSRAHGFKKYEAT